MATLKGRAQQKLFSVRKRVRISPLSVGDAHAVGFTVIRSSARALYQAAMNSAGASRAKMPDARVFDNAIWSIIDHRHGSIYAAFVTAIDSQKVFHGDRFATALARLGVTDDLLAKLQTDGFGEIAASVAYKAPWFWADNIVKEISTVRKEVSTVVQRVMSKFGEEVTETDVNDLVENLLFNQGNGIKALAATAPRAQFMLGAAALQVSGGYQQIYLNLFRQMAQTRRVGLLNPNSSVEGTFETFHQHLMTNSAALQKMLPGAKFGKTKMSPSQLQRLFQDGQLVRKLKSAFISSYDKTRHDIPMDNLYRAMRRYSVHDEIDRAARRKLNKKLNQDAIAGIISGTVGLFFAFAGDTKGQSFPAMKSIKG